MDKIQTSEQIGTKLLASIREMNADKRGRVTQVKVPNAALARSKSGLSQSQFAELLGVSIRTLQNWEQGRTQPSGAAKTLILVAENSPQALLSLRS